MKCKCSGITFAIFAFLYQIAVLLMYGLLVGYDRSFNKYFHFGEFAMVSSLLILLIVGFGLVSTYITKASIQGIAFTLLIFAMTFQSYFLWKTFWIHSGLYQRDQIGSFADPPFHQFIAPTNIGAQENNRIASVTDAIACAIALFLAYLPAIGRVGLWQLFAMTQLGVILWDVNNGLFWKLQIDDSGFGMRIFVFGPVMGMISALCLGRRDLTLNHPNYKSSYYTAALALLGIAFVWCTLPFLTLANLYNMRIATAGAALATSTLSSMSLIYYVMPGVINMWFALAAGVLGAFTISLWTYQKAHIYDIIFAAIAGGISWSSSADLQFNPAAPIVTGYFTGMIASFLNQKFDRFLNSAGVNYSLSIFKSFLIPGIIAGFISSITAAIGHTSFQGSAMNKPTDRSINQQGGYQLAGLALSIGIGGLAGVVVGIFYCCNRFTKNNHVFNDEYHFDLQQAPILNQPDQPQHDAKHTPTPAT